LVEVIISVAVLCLVCGIILRLFVSADDLRKTNVDIEKAQVLALNKMEELKTAVEPLPKDILTEPDFDGSFTLVEYFDEDWNRVHSGDEPTYLLKTIIKPSGYGLYTEGSFGNGEVSSGLTSDLFELKVIVTDRETNKELAVLESAKYYCCMGVGE